MNKGFTVIELLVAATITVVLAGILIAVTSGALNIWHRNQTGLTNNAQVKLVFDLLERDLQAAVAPNGEETRFAADVINSSATLDNHGWNTLATQIKPNAGESIHYLAGSTVDDTERRIASARFGLSGVWLRFLTTNAESTGSMPVVLSYQIARRPVTGAVANTNNVAVRYTLFRSVVSAANTFATGYSVTSDAYGSNQNQPDTTRSPTTLTNPNNSDALCANVVDFGIWLYRRQDDGSLKQVFPETDTSPNLFRAVGENTTGATVNYPDYADVMIRILSEGGAAQLENMERGLITKPARYATQDDWWWAIVESNSSVYVERIAIGGSHK